MNFKNSTIEDPIGFFEDYFRRNGILKHFDEFKEWCIKEQNSHPEFVRAVILDNDCIIETKSYNYALDDDGNLITKDKIEDINLDFFSKEVEKLLKSEIEKSKVFLKDACKMYLLNYNDANKFLNFHIVLIDDILQDCTVLFKKFPYCTDYLNALKNYIHNLFISILKGVDITQLASSPKQFHADYKDALIHEIFDFWKQPINNGKGPVIMEEEEHNRLISLVNELIKTEKVPEIKKQFDSLPIPKVLITFCFYVLKKKLYGDSRGKNFFTQFLKNAFIDLKDYRENTFKRKFATRPAIAEKWYPKIILESINED